jgi:homoserine O-acetyltransferase/O-succinyltransferase
VSCTAGPCAIHPPGEVENAILLIHGTTHTGKQFLAKDFRDAMFGPGQPLDAASTTLSYYQT